MGRISVAAYRAKPGKEQDLLDVIADRLPLLRRLGLATDRAPVLMRAKDGTLIEVSEWVDDEAIRAAHADPEVLAKCERFGGCCDFVKLADLAETHDDFAGFEAVGEPT